MLRKRLLLVFIFLGMFVPPAAGSIIRKPPVKATDVSYKDLDCTPQDREKIHEIISTVGEKGKLGLLFQQGHLRELGAQINHVHPLKFLATIFKDPHLKSCMYYIWDDYFKRNNFLDGLIPRLEGEAEKGKLGLYINDFAADLQIPSHGFPALKAYFDARDWEGMVLFLIQS
ncbi:MAG: hypothetical protein WCF19_00155 [Chlamydiales bacterium]